MPSGGFPHGNAGGFAQGIAKRLGSEPEDRVAVATLEVPVDQLVIRVVKQPLMIRVVFERVDIIENEVLRAINQLELLAAGKLRSVDQHAIESFDARGGLEPGNAVLRNLMLVDIVD